MMGRARAPRGGAGQGEEGEGEGVGWRGWRRAGGEGALRAEALWGVRDGSEHGGDGARTEAAGRKKKKETNPFFNGV
jgi:hypothetical protein